MTAHVHIDPTTDPVTDDVEFCRVCNPLPQYKETVDEGGGATLIGPFHVAFNDAGIAVSPGKALVTLPAGTVVVKSWWIVTADIEGDLPIVLRSMVGADGWTVTTYTEPGGPISALDYSDANVQVEVDPGDTRRLMSATLVVAGPLSARMWSSGVDGVLTAGTADVYALVVIP